jgi:glycosyltransferase involved in cell wall biosynthesis
MLLLNSLAASGDPMDRTTVIIPVRNGSNFVAEAIASALAQIGPADQVIVVWDVSTDGTQSMIERMSDPRVRAIRGPGLGVSAARNVGLAAADGDLVAFLDHDDMWPQNRHGTMIRALLDDPQLDAVFGRMRIKLESGATPWQWIVDYDGRHVPGPNLGTGLFRHDVLRKIGGFDVTLHFGEDLDYFDRLREAGMRFGLCDVDGLIYRRHATNCTNDQRAVQQSIFEVIKRKMARAKSPNQERAGETE